MCYPLPVRTIAIQPIKLAYRIAVLGTALLLTVLGSYGTALAGTTITVNTTADELNADGDCSLREAIQAANTDSAVDACPAGSGGDTITLPAGTYTLAIAGTGEDSNATGDLDITSNLTINGADAATTIIDGGAIDRVLDIRSASVDVTDVTITGGRTLSAQEDGGGIRNESTLAVTRSIVRDNTGPTSGGAGGGIYNNGVLTIMKTTIRDNSTQAGAGIYNFGGALTLVNSTVFGNGVNATVGGGLWNNGSMVITNSTVSGNSPSLLGGGIISDGTLELNNTTIIGNSAATGGGIANEFGGTLSATNTIVADNVPAAIVPGLGLLLH